jgi:hypothetical protein
LELVYSLLAAENSKETENGLQDDGKVGLSLVEKKG